MTKTKKTIYWIATVWLALGMSSGGIVQLIRMEDSVKSFQHLGYPTLLIKHFRCMENSRCNCSVNS